MKIFPYLLLTAAAIYGCKKTSEPVLPEPVNNSVTRHTKKMAGMKHWGGWSINTRPGVTDSIEVIDSFSLEVITDSIIMISGSAKSRYSFADTLRFREYADTIVSISFEGGITLPGPGGYHTYITYFFDRDSLYISHSRNYNYSNFYYYLSTP